MTTEFVYSLNRSGLVLREEVETLLDVIGCRTWGALARRVGLTQQELCRRFGDRASEAVFDVCEALMGGPGAELIPDPFRAAFREFQSKLGELSWHPLVLRHVEYGTGVAGSNAQIVSFDDERGLKQIETLAQANHLDIVFVRDENLFARLEQC